FHALGSSLRRSKNAVQDIQTRFLVVGGNYHSGSPSLADQRDTRGTTSGYLAHYEKIGIVSRRIGMNGFFAELKRRNVYKVALAYIVAGWALSQGIAQVLPVFNVPNWIIRLIVLLVIIGLPIALALAWMFEITSQGIKRTETADAMLTSVRQKQRAWI